MIKISLTIWYQLNSLKKKANVRYEGGQTFVKSRMMWNLICFFHFMLLYRSWTSDTIAEGKQTTLEKKKKFKKKVASSFGKFPFWQLPDGSVECLKLMSQTKSQRKQLTTCG